MSNSFEQLKKNRQSQFANLKDEADKLNSNYGGDDNRFWKPTVDKSGNGSALIRFLPATEGENVPFVRYWDHGFQGPGGWYIEKSLTSLGLPDPLGEYNQKLWNSGIEANKEIARAQKRRLHYVSNILVITDPANHDNDGKVFLYKYGKSIFDMIQDLMNPEPDPLDPRDPINPFDLWEGANFRMKIRNKDGYRNYEKSSFDAPSPLSEDEEELERVWQMTYPIKEFVDPSNYSTYEALLKKLNRVLGMDTTMVTFTGLPQQAQPSENSWSPPAKEAKKFEEESPGAFESSSDDDDDDDDEGIDFFRNLAKEDLVDQDIPF